MFWNACVNIQWAKWADTVVSPSEKDRGLGHWNMFGQVPSLIGCLLKHAPKKVTRQWLPWLPAVWRGHAGQWCSWRSSGWPPSHFHWRHAAPQKSGHHTYRLDPDKALMRDTQTKNTYVIKDPFQSAHILDHMTPFPSWGLHDFPMMHSSSLTSAFGLYCECIAAAFWFSFRYPC